MKKDRVLLKLNEFVQMMQTCHKYHFEQSHVFLAFSVVYIVKVRYQFRVFQFEVLWISAI